jgi:8-amino-7-oxononanoate synthase
MLDYLVSEGRFRKLPTLPQKGLNLSSNDYLSLAQDERVKDAAIVAIQNHGTSASASRLVTGHLELHAELESRLADYLGTESALVFGSGFLTNLGVLTSLAGRNDQIFADRLNHASLTDGSLQSRAKFIRYQHNDIPDLKRLIELHPSTGKRLIVTESIFSMDGDIAPLAELIKVADEIDAILVVDEAHAVGVFGTGILSAIKERPKNLVIVGTLSKSLGSYGGFAACSAEIKSYFINTARSFIYSTGLPPSSCAAALAALRIIREERVLGDKLIAKARILYQALEPVSDLLLPFESQIIPVIVKDNNRSVEIQNQLYNRGIICTAVRPPTVPENTARLRLSVNLCHTEAELLRAAEEIVRLWHY